MKVKWIITVVATGVALALLWLSVAARELPITNRTSILRTVNRKAGVGTGFNYQGVLIYADNPANGFFDLQFSLFDADIHGVQVSQTISLSNQLVVDGLLSVELNFGDVFAGGPLWLEIAVRPAGNQNAFTTLQPRQALNPTPYAIFAATAEQARRADHAPWSGVLGVPAGFADGVDDDTQLSEAQVETYITNGPLDLSTGTTISGNAILTVTSGGCDDIQAAVNGLPPGGGQVIVAVGVYTCTQPIVIARDNVVLQGHGSGTLLVLADNANSPVLVIGSIDTPVSAHYANILISDLAIDGNRLNQSLECWGGVCDTGGSSYIRNNGITLRGVIDVVVERVRVASARSGGLVVERGSSRLTVRDLRSVDNHFDGLAAYQTQDSLFNGLYLVNNCAAGLSLDIDFDNNIFTDVYISRDGEIACAPLPESSVGVFMRDSRDNLFDGMQITNLREHGIFLAQVVGDPSSAPDGNTFTSLLVSGSGMAGIRVNDALITNTLISGAQFAGNSGGCISEASPGQVLSVGVICR